MTSSGSRLHVVVVLNWHGRVDTLACVDSLVNGSPEAAVLVVDNGSRDGTLGDVTARWPSVHTLELPENRGFAGGMNSGIRYALSSLDADTVTVLNNDTVVEPGAMARLQSFASAGDRAVSPVVRYRDAPEVIWFGGGSLDTKDGYPHHTPPGELGPCVEGLRSSTLLAGCCITASATTWLTVGLFDEDYFLNFEDSEWSVRASARGVELAVACEVGILHAVSASFIGKAARLGSFYFLRNGLMFTRVVGAGRGARARFVRRFGLSGLRGQSARERCRSLTVLVWAVAAYLTRQRGEAPRSLRNLVDRWDANQVIR